MRFDVVVESAVLLAVGNLEWDKINPDIFGSMIQAVAIVASRLHLAWVATVCGKLKNDYRYSNTLGWNTFPVPALTDHNKRDLNRTAEDILLTRAAHFPASLNRLKKRTTICSETWLVLRKLNFRISSVPAGGGPTAADARSRH